MEIQVSQGYLQARINAYKKKYVIEYFKENNTYPSIDEIANMTIPDDVIANINRDYYVNYLISEANRLNEDVVVPDIPDIPTVDDLSGLVTANDMNGCWKLISDSNLATESIECYIEFNRSGQTFCLYQNLGSFDGKFRKYDGDFQLKQITSEVDTKTILIGQYYDGETWATHYYITIVDDKMRLVATHDDSIVQEYVRIDSIPEEVINQVTTPIK